MWHEVDGAINHESLKCYKKAQDIKINYRKDILKAQSHLTLTNITPTKKCLRKCLMKAESKYYSAFFHLQVSVMMVFNNAVFLYSGEFSSNYLS